MIGCVRCCGTTEQPCCRAVGRPALAVEWKPLSLEATPAWSELTNELAEADDTGEFYSAADLTEELSEDGVDPSQDTIGVWQDGRLVGFGQLRVAAGLFEGRVSAWLGGGVSPAYRGRGYGRQIQDFLERRALVLAAERHPGVEVLFRAPGLREGASVRALLAHRGYSVTRYFHDMALALPAQVELAGLIRRSSRTRPELSEAVRLAHNEAFAEHWGSTGNTPERWQDFVGSHTVSARPQLRQRGRGRSGRRVHDGAAVAAGGGLRRSGRRPAPGPAPRPGPGHPRIGGERRLGGRAEADRTVGRHRERRWRRPALRLARVQRCCAPPPRTPKSSPPPARPSLSQPEATRSRDFVDWAAKCRTRVSGSAGAAGCC